MRLRLLTAALGALAGVLVAGSALAAAADQGADVKVYDYAVENPVDDSPLPIPPSLGETVPRTVSLVPLSKESGYAYFYYNGSPVIVDMRTRSVVRFGQ
ncbi:MULTISPECIES: DUF1236 domain-containing protein [unclassified Aureimonas]|uniref:DUF1236 domain-containing protein n=1 Tax=unclassified Aureimonas TaxID=2615206 RepID=UPI0006F361C5|nr:MULTISPECIES: DUF1236 domain-containing protein [unclassified Aureimonas]KQT64329.1 hypothetical protein ASG62_04920 [Aureimonas sp. Leaf427]KQT81518.1 hypothetical protein ASG54_02185 [Aureimonas sp. Leaf460]